MTQKLLKMMQAKGYFNQHKKILVAVSGGADSMSLLHFCITIKKIWIFSWGLLTLTINNDKSRSMKKRIYVIGQRNIRSLFTIVPSQESFQKMLPVPFAMSF